MDVVNFHVDLMTCSFRLIDSVNNRVIGSFVETVNEPEISARLMSEVIDNVPWGSVCRVFLRGER